ncbi:hypothetical protein EDD18DRAFT_1360433 [Armillaria luteobubalina]|uniref:Uncharacterized protein n=1 Tax=Armillaria luteobubalina TaxID=153913 RepID=A0AA39PLZ4_9AGAR|nr:hypothetical protein EDD18DRAFT_1360433 [Armillaria luteobubalina]
MPAIHRLIIQALSGISPGCIARAKKVFSPHWDEIREEKDRMLMDCMDLSRDGSSRWIPKDIPNIELRIEPLVRLEILFPTLHRKLPSGPFGEHDLDFSKTLSNTLSITLSAIDDAHIQKPREPNQVIMDALANNYVHHTLVWEKLLDHYIDKEKLIHSFGDRFTIEMCLNLVTSIYLPEDSPLETYTCTLAYTLITSHRKETLTGLLAFFQTSESDNLAVDLEQRLSLAIVCALVPDSTPSSINSRQPPPFCHDCTIFKYRLLRVALCAIKNTIRSADPPSKEWRTHLFWAILSYIKSDLFSGHALSNSEYWEFEDLLWACRAYALVCLAILTSLGPKYRVFVREQQWNDKDLVLSILRVIHEERAVDTPVLPPGPALLKRGTRDHVDSIIYIAGWFLGHAFDNRTPGVYEAFQEKGSLRYIAEKSSLHPEIIEGLRGYINGLSSAKAGKLPDIQLDNTLDRHIEDLHQAPVIRCICASIARSGTPSRPILSTLASIAPYHDQWSNILQTLNSPDHEYSVQCYALHPKDKGTRDDVERWKKDMKKNVSILTECLEEENRRNRDNHQPGTSSSNRAGGLETHHESGLTMDPNTDVELGALRSENVDAS